MLPRVLVIEDAPHWYRLLERILEDIQCVVDIAKDPDEVDYLLERFTYDLVVLDVCLDQPTLNLACQQFCFNLHQKYPNLPIVAITGKPLSASNGFSLAKLGVIDYVDKNTVQLPDLRRLILAVLRKPIHNSVRLHNTHALLIGVGNYTHHAFANLAATVRDVQVIASILTDPARSGYPLSSVQVIAGDQATAANIRAAMLAKAQSTNSQSTVFLYFSGHGGRALEDGRWRAYLCPREANPDDLVRTAISGKEFSDLLAALPARKLLVILDACHAAGSAEFKSVGGTPVWKTGLPESYYEALSQGSGRVIIASSKADQISYVRPQGDLSLFTYHLRNALSGEAAVRGDGLIHVLDVFHYVNEKVQVEEPRQTPILKVKDMDLDFPVALDRGGKGMDPTRVEPDVFAIREQIIRDPVSGAKALSDYLATMPKWAARRDEVDLKRADLERTQHDTDLFGLGENDKASHNRAVYFLLRVCRELGRPEQ